MLCVGLCTYKRQPKSQTLMPNLASRKRLRATYKASPRSTKFFLHCMRMSGAVRRRKKKKNVSIVVCVCVCVNEQSSPPSSRWAGTARPYLEGTSQSSGLPSRARSNSFGRIQYTNWDSPDNDGPAVLRLSGVGDARSSRCAGIGQRACRSGRPTHVKKILKAASNFVHSGEKMASLRW